MHPLPSTAFHILLALVDQDRHGCGIMRQVAEQTDNKVRLGPGTLYGSIITLLEEKLIQEVDDRVDPKLGAERRRYYRLTAAGRKVAAKEADRLAMLLRVARNRRVWKGSYV